jgi:hypothetical protein
MDIGKITFNRFVVGAAGDTVTPYQTMVLASNGKVGINETSPSAQLQVASTGGNGGGGYSDYNILTSAGGGNQATIGAMHDGDGYASLNLGSNVSGYNVFWHISKRTSGSTDLGGNNGLDFWYNYGYGFTNVFGFSTEGNFKAAGSIQMADDTATASADKVGTMRYRTGTEYVEVTGTELVTNGDFATDSGWTKGTGWTISGGTANAATATSDFTQTVSFTLGQTYRLTYTVSNYSAGALRTSLGAYIASTPISANGNYTDIFTPTNVSSNSLLYFEGQSGFTGSIDNVSLIEVTAEDASYADMCMQTGASTYEWVNIVRNTY